MWYLFIILGVSGILFSVKVIYNGGLLELLSLLDVLDVFEFV